MVAFQPFSVIGNDGGLLMFWTPSWSRPEHGGHEIHFEVSTQQLWCQCEDASCRMKNRRKPGDPRLCKHCKRWSEVIWPVIAPALGMTAPAQSGGLQ